MLRCACFHPRYVTLEIYFEESKSCLISSLVFVALLSTPLSRRLPQNTWRRTALITRIRYLSLNDTRDTPSWQETRIILLGRIQKEIGWNFPSFSVDVTASLSSTLLCHRHERSSWVPDLVAFRGLSPVTSDMPVTRPNSVNNVFPCNPRTSLR